MSIFNNLFGQMKVTEKTYNKFINTGEVPINIIRMIAFKVIRQEPLNNQELAIFHDKTHTINEMIIKITENK